MAATNRETRITAEVAEFVAQLRFDTYPPEAVRIGKRCILDGLGLVLAGSTQQCSRILRNFILRYGQQQEAYIYGEQCLRAPVMLAALANGTAGHAMDWDDTQLSSSPDRIFGLLTHPTMPPFTACLAVAEKLGGVSGTEFLSAFLAGFEVECKIAEAIKPKHYQQGFHSSGTIGTFGAAVAAGKLMGLTVEQLRHTIGIAASMAAGIRVNFGTMVKPLHVGRAAENGVTAALLAADGYQADPNALDGPWGYFKVAGGGVDVDKISGALGNPFSIVSPGVSIKPYPCGVLTHPSMDAMLKLVQDHDLQPEDIKKGVLYAGSNILNPIRYQVATNELEAKFCMPFLLTAMVVSRKAGVKEFTDDYVNSPQVQELMRRFRTEFDPAIEAKGFDRIRSRLEVTLRDGRTLVQEADERYRGGPENPLSDQELQAKFADCTQDLLDRETREKVFQAVASLEDAASIEEAFSLVRT